jgi:hypothetical protein
MDAVIGAEAKIEKRSKDRVPYTDRVVEYLTQLTA